MQGECIHLESGTGRDSRGSRAWVPPKAHLVSQSRAGREDIGGVAIQDAMGGGDSEGQKRQVEDPRQDWQQCEGRPHAKALASNPLDKTGLETSVCGGTSSRSPGCGCFWQPVGRGQWY